MKIGTVQHFDEVRGSGVIRTEEGEEVQVHYSVIAGGGYRSLRSGETVRVSVAPGPRGPQASLVVKPEPALEL